ncbi:DHH family phosphoesterase [Maledivibacter halophilus]|uniref:Phosphoesterase RecJ domain-containing protein n=1 Tax=Maledivibacter halophilus TaxID=36842 RepID=A0A1T5LFB1_9FIRM|nr:bifunctional oligoribonuclease/PAP phosphatase NrnA [Maledivibacter halophilus]SKC74078.1 phosphoesterase RecJ domain-containing protein [Maledivibacter halophilus]
MMMNNILNLLRGSQKIIILPHILPDGDTLGSSLALKRTLEILGKKALILIDDEIPSNLNFMINHNSIMSTKTFLSLDFKPDLIVTIDTSDIERLGDRRELLDLNDEILNIDHHKTNINFGKYNLVDSNASSCGEIIYKIINDLEIELDKDISTYLYVSLSTDTGSFKYSNTTPKTLRIAADLLEKGIDSTFIVTMLYQNKPMNKIKLLSDALNTLEIHYDGKLAMIHVTNKMFEENNISPSNSDGIIEYARDIEGVEVAVFLKELSFNEIKVGFRSKYYFDVSLIAGEFNGGGHKKASGCTIFDTMINAKEKIKEKLRNKL